MINDDDCIQKYISVAPRYLRSINLVNDKKHLNTSKGYIATPAVLQALERICMGILSPEKQSVFSIIGPYGTGKSAFVVFLCQLFSKQEEIASTALKVIQDHPDLVKLVEKVRSKAIGPFGYLPVTITARRRPVSQLILEALAGSILDLDPTDPKVLNLSQRIDEAIDKSYWIDSAIVINFLDELGKLAAEQQYNGLLLIIDEAGKTLEYALFDREGGDIYILQELAEYATRQKTWNIAFIITLHQLFSDYVELTEKTTRAEWTKIQERFQPLQFTESAATTIRLVVQAISHKIPNPIDVEKAIDLAVDRIEKSNIPLPLGIAIRSFRNLCHKAWPFHPLTLLVNPYIFRRLAQNERSIFSFLTSQESFGFQEHLLRSFHDNSGFILISNMYDYLVANHEASLAKTSYAKKIFEAQDAIASKQDLSIEQASLIKTIAILNVVSEISPLKASSSFLECSSEKNISENIQILLKKSIINFRRLDDSYRVWEGSDIDIDLKMAEARIHLKLDETSFIDTLRQNMPKQIIVAKKNCAETGAYRYFEVDYSDHIDPNDPSIATCDSAATGKFLIVFPYSDKPMLTKMALEATKNQNRLVIAIPTQADALRSSLEEFACLHWVEDNVEQLRDDRVARRELVFRMVEAEQRITKFCQMIRDPRPAPIGSSCKFYWNNTVVHCSMPVDVTRLVSKACDGIFPSSPRIRNELIARHNISSSAAGARRNLIEKMLVGQAIKQLGIEGFPPELSIYESTLHAAGIHHLIDEGFTWQFGPPPEGNPVNLRPCWDVIEHSIFRSNIERVELKELFSTLSEAPFGLPEGIHPILFIAFFLVNQENLFLYREGSFVPDPQIAHFELLCRRPNLFSISGIRVSGTRRVIVDRFSKGLNCKPTTSGVVRALYRIITGLPEITMKSSQFPTKLPLEMRDLFVNARSPEELLFVRLPQLFDLEPFQEDIQPIEVINKFFDNLNDCINILLNHANDVKEKSKDQLILSCGIRKRPESWSELERKALFLAPRISHEIITPFLNSIINGIANNHNPIPALSFVIRKPLEIWTDKDVERFEGMAIGIGEIFISLMQLHEDPNSNLTEDEVEASNKAQIEIERYIMPFAERIQPKILIAALKKLISNFEFKYGTSINEQGIEYGK